MNGESKGPAIQLTIRLFAQAAQIAAASTVDLELSSEAGSSKPLTIQKIAAALSQQYPLMGELIQRSRWAVDGQFVNEYDAVDREQEIALIPPVSGG